MLNCRYSLFSTALSACFSKANLHKRVIQTTLFPVAFSISVCSRGPMMASNIKMSSSNIENFF